VYRLTREDVDVKFTISDHEHAVDQHMTGSILQVEDDKVCVHADLNPALLLHLRNTGSAFAHALALANENSPAFVMGGFQITSVLIKDESKIVEAFRTGKGVDWGG
jgi:hypothetical protein